MNESVSILAGVAGSQGASLAVVASSITLAFIIVALTLPKILNSVKSDRLDGNVLKRVQDLETKAVSQDAKIHRYAVRVTKLTVLVLKLHALLIENKVQLTQEVIDEILYLTKESESDEE